jgi:prolyl-tRNA synthetase
LGLKVLRKIEGIIRSEMDSSGGQEILLPALHPAELWKDSGRYEKMGEVMIRFRNRHGKEVILGPTHEEVITDLVKREVNSYRRLPLLLYQIQTKFRDEPRPRFGIIRSCEFIMKDAYSFDKDNQGLDEIYLKMREAYCRIFDRCGLSYLITQADPGVMGGSESCEFMVPAESGEDVVMRCSSCNHTTGEDVKICPHCNRNMQAINCIETGHVFKLGTKYSESFKACYLDTQGEEKLLIMGCYGIGINRILAAVIEQNNDREGIIWPQELAPYKVIVIPLNINHAPSKTLAGDIYGKLSNSTWDVLIDDRDERAGSKFKDADLIGIPLAIIIGEKGLKEGKIEIKLRKSGESISVKAEDALAKIQKLLK